MSLRERRPEPRVPFCIPVFLRGDGVISREVALNVSSGGMFIRTSRYFRPGTELELVFTFSQQPVHTRASVVWVTEGLRGNTVTFAQGLGIQFQTLPLSLQHTIKRCSAQFHRLP